MKMEFQFTGDVNALMMAMLSMRPFVLTSGETTLKVEPKKSSREGTQLNIKSGNVSSETVIAIPVNLPAFGGEAIMSFPYNVEDVVVAPAVPAVEALDERPTVYGISDEGNVQCWHVREHGIHFDEQHLKDGILIGAKEYKGHDARPATEARPAVKVSQFKRSGSHSLTIKFE